MQKTDAQDIRLVRAVTSRRLGTGRDRLISIILPIKNRARNAKALLSRLHAQRYEGSIEIIAVDSGSTDDTIPVLSEAGATVLTVPPSQFDYGLTRNAAARHARGDVFVFITSTMLPADDAWLRHLLDAYDSDETLAGVYSRSIPRPDADILNYRDYLLADLRTNRQEASTIRDGLYVRAIEDRDAHAGLSPSRLRHLVEDALLVHPHQAGRRRVGEQADQQGDDGGDGGEGHREGAAQREFGILYGRTCAWGEQ